MRAASHKPAPPSGRASTSAEILAAFNRAKRDPATDERMRRVLAQTQRNGRVGDLKQLSLACQMSRARLEACLDTLTRLGYLPGNNTSDTRGA